MNIMRNSILILLIVFSCCVRIIGQTIGSEDQHKLLEISVSNSKVNYCDRGNVYIVFDIAIKNIDERPLILYKDFFIPNKTMIFVDGNAQEKKEPVQRAFGLVHFVDYLDSEKEFDDKLFSIIQPREKIVLKHVFFSVTIPTGKLKYGLKSGNYFASINIVTFPFYATDAVKLNSKWSKFGYLWTKDVKIPNINFSIERSVHETKVCENYLQMITRKGNQ
jgi:hypothetical protein